MSENLEQRSQPSPDDWPQNWPPWVLDIAKKMEAAEDSQRDWIPVESRAWVASMSLQLVKGACPTLQRDVSSMSGPRMLGRLIGHQKELSENLQSQCQKVEKALEEFDAKLRQKLSPKTYQRWMKKGEKYGKDFTRFWEELEGTLQKKEALAKEAVSIAYDKPASERDEFFSGITDAKEKKFYDEQGNAQLSNHRLMLYMLMVMFWRYVETFQTSTQLYRWCCLWLGGEARVGDLETFQRLMRQHKVRLGARGKSFHKRRMQRRNRR